jgi:Uncharacterized protein conserved in bacteria
MTRATGNGYDLDASAFVDRIERVLNNTDGIEVLKRDGMELEVRTPDADMRLNVQTFYTAYLQNPLQVEHIIHTLIKTLQGFQPDRSTSSYAALRERIYPMLKPIALLAEVRDRQLPLILYRPFLADLMIAYVIDEADSVAFINEEHLAKWEIAEHRIHNQALANLRQRTLNATDYTTVGTGAQRLFIFSSQDGYDATRILLPEVLDRWRVQLPGRMVIGIPNRDFLIAFSDVDRMILHSMAHQIQRDSIQRPYGLTDQLFTLINGEIHVYELE